MSGVSADVVSFIRHICLYAGNADLVEELISELEASGIREAVARHDTPALFEWLVSVLSFQGVSDAVAAGYLEAHGTVRWANIAADLAARPSCPKLASYWQFDGCGFHKASRTCAEPEHIACCPLPSHPHRNGRLNQTTYALFLFIRDVAHGDFIGWIDAVLDAADDPASPDRVDLLINALLDALHHLPGIADKVVSMALSAILLGCGARDTRWALVGSQLIVVDTLVHNFLHRAGILDAAGRPHAYGQACYQPNGCAAMLRAAAGAIDATQFNPRFPANFPRFVQHAIWRYCARDHLNVCNGNRIDDRYPCKNDCCRLFRNCAKMPLNSVKSG